MSRLCLDNGSGSGGRGRRCASTARPLDIQSGVRGWTYLCATCTRSNLRSIESRLFDRDTLRFGTVN
jgi:hypothetical protein